MRFSYWGGLRILFTHPFSIEIEGLREYYKGYMRFWRETCKLWSPL